MTPTPDNIELLEIVDAIADSDVIEDGEKVDLLKRIDAEQGISSDGLREDIVALFRRQADAETSRIREHDVLIAKSRASAPSSVEDDKEAQLILGEAVQGQATVSREVQALVDSVRADVNRMDRAASQAAENVRKAGDQQSIDQIRRNLASGSETAA